MGQLKQIETFVSVVNLGSFSAVARQEKVVPAVIGRRLDALEERLGVKLLVRTTRSIGLTQEGSAFYEDSQRILQELQDAEAAVARRNSRVGGELHLLAPATFARRYIVPHIAEFQQQQPDLRIAIDLSDRVADLARERIDCAIRISELEDSSMVAVRLAEISRVLVAAPSYLARRGGPKTPADLDHHDCLLLMGDSQSRGWIFKGEDGLLFKKVRGMLECSDGTVLHEWVLDGLGVAWRPLWEVKEDLAQGRLVSLLEDYPSPNDPVYAVLAQRKFMPGRVRLFIDFLRTVYAREGYWD